MKNTTPVRAEKKVAVVAPSQATPASPPKPTEALSSESKIRELAYEKWESAGCPEGDGVEFWLAAERQIIASDQA